MNNLALCILFKNGDVKWENLKIKNCSLKFTEIKQEGFKKKERRSIFFLEHFFSVNY